MPAPESREPHDEKLVRSPPEPRILRAGTAYLDFVAADGSSWRVSDWVERTLRNVRVRLGDGAAALRQFRAPDDHTFVYRFTRVESHDVTAERLERQLRGAGHCSRELKHDPPDDLR